MIGGFRSDLSITLKTDKNFGNVSAGVNCFPKSCINKNGGKDDFQFVLCTLQSLFAFFVLFHARHLKM